MGRTTLDEARKKRVSAADAASCDDRDHPRSATVSMLTKDDDVTFGLGTRILIDLLTVEKGEERQDTPTDDSPRLTENRPFRPR